MDETNPYPALLGLNWAIDMGGIISLKRRSMIFENDGTWVIVPLDPVEGERYTKHVCEGDDINHIYKMIAWDEDWINPTTDGMLNWEKDSLCFSDLDGNMENQQNWLHDVSVLRCLKITKNFQCISLEVRELPYIDGFGSVKEFLAALEKAVPEQ